MMKYKQRSTPIKDKINESYSSILKLVRDEGWTKSEAISKFGIHRATFYRSITEEQKRELDTAKKLNSGKELELRYLIQ